MVSTGESGDGGAGDPALPMWMHSTTRSSLHARQKGSQASLWMLGKPTTTGFSRNVTA
jgi:hypothetical protein